jgi:geranylgeranyl diphosphate synthase, type II
MTHYTELAQQYDKFRIDNTFTGTPQSLYDPINYLLEIGGKRIRPVLALMGYELYKPLDNSAFHIAHAVELFHNFSLMHDDIMDEAPLRRGVETVHIKWDQSTAILSGDLMLIKAYESLLKTEANKWPGLLHLFNQTATWVCEGQQFDMNFEKEAHVEELAYVNMIRLKTAVLLGAALQMGAIGAGASIEESNHLFGFGENVGIAFQLMDDYLDVFGSAQSGKQAGGDILSNKKTLIYLKAMQLADDKTKAELTNWFAQTGLVNNKVESVTSIFKSLQIDEIILKLADEYYVKAASHLEQLNKPKEDMLSLLELTKYLKNRSH